MNDKKSPDTRGRILETALDLFSERGYQGSSMREIADRLDITKATVFYHFPSKAVLLATLCEPLSEDLEDVLARARPADDLVRFRRELIEGTLDVYIRNRKVLYVLIQDLTMLAQDGTFRRLISLMERIHGAFAGPSPDISVRIRAVQIFAMLGDPVFLCRDVPVARLRAEILAGVWALLDEPTTAGLVTREEADLGPRIPPPARRRAGRPSVMSEEKAELARRMYAEGVHGVAEIAERLGVSRATVYRHLGERAGSR
ncbi:TetR family transcriptional regulator [Actinomadura sp. KC345]|uniref:TetR family transcriptional regulator n=1 Tax=Actinomadura sp. KC345 TaxID=2530371 RepID=UPI00104F02DF|nr:TetR family transcriptional regulator [Actinomadura sp. KC345]TDC58447.1 TetR family transcriptional regulator [Actinomadura sp. KC345]